jgi:hypothetical protein
MARRSYCLTGQSVLVLSFLTVGCQASPDSFPEAARTRATRARTRIPDDRLADDDLELKHHKGGVSVAGTTVTSGPVVVTLNDDLGLTVSFGEHGTASVLPPAVFIHGHQYTLAAQGSSSSATAYTLQCRPALRPWTTSGSARGDAGGFGVRGSNLVCKQRRVCEYCS